MAGGTLLATIPVMPLWSVKVSTHECYIEFESGNETTNMTLSLGMRPLT